MDPTPAIPPRGASERPEPRPAVAAGGHLSAPSRDGRLRYATTALAVGLLSLGTFWRLIDLQYPMSYAFDEHHFVRNARNYMARQADWNDHPPLGKLLLVPGIRWLGDNGGGWRLSSAVLGLALVLLSGLIASELFNSRRVGLLAATFVAIDGFFISYSRVALPDTPLTVFIYAALALMLWAPSLPWFAAAAVCVGLAVATKWTGVCILLVAPSLLRRRGRAFWHAVWMFAVAAAVYVVIVILALRITRQPSSVAGLLGSSLRLLRHHAGFTAWDNGASSKWFTWPFLWHPILMHYAAAAAADPNRIRATTSLGNVLLWFATTTAMIGALLAAGRALRGARRAHPAAVTTVTPDDRAGWLVLATMAALILPFMLTRRQSYIFHYLASYGLGLGLLASAVVELERRRPGWALAFVATAAAISIFYAPVWTNAPISRAAFMLRLPFPGWH